MHLWQIKKLHSISVFKYAGSFRMTLSRRWRDFWRAEHSTLEKCRIELTLKLAFAPPFLNRETQIELALFPTLTLSQDDEVMRPRQLSHQRRDNCVILIGLVELPHSEQVRPTETTDTRLGPGDILRESIHGGV